MSSVSIHIDNYFDAIFVKKLIPGAFNVNRTLFTFDTIQSTNAGGKILLWTINVKLLDENDEDVVVVDEYLKPPAQELTDMRCMIEVISLQEGGKIRDSSPTFVDVGKNLGKINATNCFTQAVRDCLGLYNKQKQKASKATKESKKANAMSTNVKDILYPPILVHKESGPAKDSVLSDSEFDEGLLLQQKFNGLRIVSFKSPETIVLYSRTCHPYLGFQYLKDELLRIFRDAPIMTRELLAEISDRSEVEISDKELAAYDNAAVYFDGEIYQHGKTLRYISGEARRETKSGDELQYHVFDCFFPAAIERGYNMVSFARQNYLDAALRGTTNVIRVQNYSINSREEMNTLIKQFLADNYEGGIIRRPHREYKYSYNNYHSTNLLKIKLVFDDEFEVVGYIDGKGKNKGLVTWICRVPIDKSTDPNDRIFNVEPKDMTQDERSFIFKHLSDAVGDGQTRFERDFKLLPLTIEYRETSTKTGKPLMPKATVFRIYEDGHEDPIAKMKRELTD